MLDSKSFRCISCLTEMNQVFRVKPPSLIPCRVCSEKNDQTTSADYYFEFSNVLIILDLLLLKKEAFVHLVFNTRLGKRPLQVIKIARVYFASKF